MRTDGSDVVELAAELDRNVGETMPVNAAAAARRQGDRIAWTADSRRLLITAADRGQIALFQVDVARGRSRCADAFSQGDLRDFSREPQRYGRGRVQLIGPPS